MSAVVATASRLTRLVGLLTIALVAAIPLMSLANEASQFLEADGMRLITTPLVVQTLLFGTTYAAIGDMTASVAASFAIMHGLRYVFTTDDGALVRRFVKPNVVRAVQKNLFDYEQQAP